MMKVKYAHLHGFSSNRNSAKGLYLKERYEAWGHELVLPELNQPSFEELTFTAALAELDRCLGADDDVVWRISGSSMGGYLAAIWAERNPGKVDRLVLLCPGFDLGRRFVELVGARRMVRWEETGSLELPGIDEELRPVHWDFIADARRYPAYPEVPCATMIIHGRADDTIPIESSRAYAVERGHVRLVEVDDDHRLMASLDVIGEKIGEFFGLCDGDVG